MAHATSVWYCSSPDHHAREVGTALNRSTASPARAFLELRNRSCKHRSTKQRLRPELASQTSFPSKLAFLERLDQVYPTRLAKRAVRSSPYGCRVLKTAMMTALMCHVKKTADKASVDLPKIFLIQLGQSGPD